MSWATFQSTGNIIQATAILPRNKPGVASPILNSGHTDFDARLLYGWNGVLLFWDSYTDIQAGYRKRGGPPADEVHLDTTIGIDISDGGRWSLDIQSFTAASIEAAEPPYDAYTSQKMQIGLNYRFDDRHTLTLGGFHTVAGTSIVRETGGFAALRFDF